MYFDFLVYLGYTFVAMGMFALPLLLANYFGDNAGKKADIFLKLSIGNLGNCGEYGELCKDIQGWKKLFLFFFV